MIISHRLKVAFFRVPKTGSTTMELILRMTGQFEDGMATNMGRYSVGSVGELPNLEDNYLTHMTPSQAVQHGLLTEAQVREYTCYAALRDPYSRAISGYAHIHANVIPLINPESFAASVKKNADYGLLQKPQVDYFYHDGEMVATPVNFGDFKNAINAIVNDVGGMPFPVLPNFNKSRGKERDDNRENYIDNNPEVKDILKTRLADDIALYEHFYGNID